MFDMGDFSLCERSHCGSINIYIELRVFLPKYLQKSPVFMTKMFINKMPFEFQITFISFILAFKIL